jgi:hypothetical protein
MFFLMILLSKVGMDQKFVELDVNVLYLNVNSQSYSIVVHSIMAQLCLDLKKIHATRLDRNFSRFEDTSIFF